MCFLMSLTDVNRYAIVVFNYLFMVVGLCEISAKHELSCPSYL